MNTVRGESSNFFVHVVVFVVVFVVQNANTSCSNTQILPNKKKKKNLKSLSLCFCFAKEVF